MSAAWGFSLQPPLRVLRPFLRLLFERPIPQSSRSTPGRLARGSSYHPPILLSSVIRFFRVILVPLGNFHDDIRRSVRDRLAAQPRLRRDAGRFVQLIEFRVRGFVARFQALMNDYVAGRAGAHTPAGMVEPHFEAFGNVQNATWQAIVTVRDFLRVHLDGFAAGKKRHRIFLRGGLVLDFFNVWIGAAHGTPSPQFFTAGPQSKRASLLRSERQFKHPPPQAKGPRNLAPSAWSRCCTQQKRNLRLRRVSALRAP